MDRSTGVRVIPRLRRTAEAAKPQHTEASGPCPAMNSIGSGKGSNNMANRGGIVQVPDCASAAFLLIEIDVRGVRE